MKILTEGDSNVAKITGKQTFRQVEYRLQKYLLHVKTDEEFLLHNVITGELISLNKKEFKLFERKEYKSLDCYHYLIEHYFLVPLEFNEKYYVDSLRQIIRTMFTSSGMNQYVIFTTTHCNARCFYCYQSNYKHIHMSSETADQLIKYIDGHKGKDPIRIQWFGGEPLVGIARIDQISKGLQDKNIEFASTMISNGYLFTDEIINRATTLWNLKTVQITLDGTEAVYNKTKAYVNTNRSAYQVVLNNINKLLANNIRVGIRLNLDKHNAKDLYDLIIELSNQIKNREIFEAYVHVLYEGEGYNPIERTAQSSEELYKRQNELNNKLKELGLLKFHVNLPSVRAYSCMADSFGGIAVYPDGCLFKCEHVREEDSVGTLESDVINKDILAKYKLPAQLKRCPSCPLYPSCMILNECDGIKDRNPIFCDYEILTRIDAMKMFYNQNKVPLNKIDENLSIADSVNITVCD